MRKLGHMLSPAIGREEVIRAAKAHRVLREWESIVGKSMAERSYPDRYDHGTVWVAVEGSAWAQELRMQKDQILERLRERSSDPTIFQNLRFGVRTVPPLEPREPELKPEPRRDQEGLSIQEIAARRLENWPREDDLP